jgi:hypothetical protein
MTSAPSIGTSCSTIPVTGGFASEPETVRHGARIPPAADLESVRRAARIERAARFLADNPPSSASVSDLLDEGFGCSQVEAHEAVFLAGRYRMLREAFA